MTRSGVRGLTSLAENKRNTAVLSENLLTFIYFLQIGAESSPLAATHLHSTDGVRGHSAARAVAVKYARHVVHCTATNVSSGHEWPHQTLKTRSKTQHADQTNSKSGIHDDSVKTRTCTRAMSARSIVTLLTSSHASSTLHPSVLRVPWVSTVTAAARRMRREFAHVTASTVGLPGTDVRSTRRSVSRGKT